jgi:hypothetical protein
MIALSANVNERTVALLPPYGKRGLPTTHRSEVSFACKNIRRATGDRARYGTTDWESVSLMPEEVPSVACRWNVPAPLAEAGTNGRIGMTVTPLVLAVGPKSSRNGSLR